MSAAESTPPVALRETCRVVPHGHGGLERRVPLWPLHAARLRSGGCGEEVVARAAACALEAIEAYTGPASSRLRLTVSVSSGGAVSCEVDRRLSSLDVPGGPVLAPVEVAAPPPLPPAAAKPADRSWWDDAMREAKAAGGHQAVLLDAEGLVLDGGTATLWAVIDGTLVTPLSPPAIAGVARRFVLDRASALGLRAQVRPLAWSEVEAAEEVFLTNAYAGAVAARGRGGDVYAAVATSFDALRRS